MKRVLLAAVCLTWATMGYANQEITVELSGGAKMEFVWIEPGTFTMGTTEEQKQLLNSKGMWNSWSNNEQPVHQVTITQGFYLGKYEITQGQWEAVMGTKPWADQAYVQDQPNHPAMYISWEDVQSFVGQLNVPAGEQLYRLPSEAEWEYACRAGTNTLWSFGDDESQLREYAWYDENAWNIGERYAHAVGTKSPNPWGLYDMHGNAWEYIHEMLYRVYTTDSQQDPGGPTPTPGSERLTRGGFFQDLAQVTRSAIRGTSGPNRNYGVGARLVRIGPPINSAVTPESWGQVKATAK